MRRQFPESGRVRGHAQAPVMRKKPTPWKLCHELTPPPEAKAELVFRERERERKAPPIRAKEIAQPLHEPRRDTLGLC